MCGFLIKLWWIWRWGHQENAMKKNVVEWRRCFDKYFHHFFIILFWAYRDSISLRLRLTVVRGGVRMGLGRVWIISMMIRGKTCKYCIFYMSHTAMALHTQMTSRVPSDWVSKGVLREKVINNNFINKYTPAQRLAVLETHDKSRDDNNSLTNVFRNFWGFIKLNRDFYIAFYSQFVSVNIHR